MKNTIGLILFGLLLQYGSADVSHLPKSGHNQYLPPPIQNLPIEQDYNGLDSQPLNERGYLPPYQNQHQQDHHHNDHHHQDHHHEHNHDHHHDQHHEHNHDHHHGQHHDHHQDQQQYQDPYDPSVQVSYHNNYAINHPQNNVNDQSHSHHHDHSHDDHVDIDQQQLEPVNPSSFPLQDYLPPTAGPQLNTHSVHNQVSPTVGTTRGEGHSISLVHYHNNHSPVSSPTPFTLPQSSSTPLTHSTSQQLFPPPHNGYQYLPPSHPTSLYPNEATGVTENSNHGGIEVTDDHHYANQGYLPPRQTHVSHISPGASVHSNHGHSHQHQDYQQRSQSSHHSHQEPQQDHLPPNQFNHANPGLDSHSNQQQGYLPPVQSNQHFGHAQPEPQQDYLPPNQLSHTHSGHVHQVPQQNYIPPGPGVSNAHDHTHHTSQNHHSGHSHQDLAQEYFPPIQSSTPSHLNHVSPGGSHHHSHQNQQQDYLPPSQSNHAHPSVASGHHHPTPQQDYIPPNQNKNAVVPSPVSHLHTSVANTHQHSGQQDLQQNNYQSNNAVDLPNPSGALHEVSPPHLGSNNQEPRSQLTVRGHLNVPLPIPQVGYFFVPGVVSTLPSLTEANPPVLRPAVNIPSIISSQHLRPTQRISSPEYTRAFLLQKKNNHPTEEKSAGIVITPSIQTMQTLQEQSADALQNSIPNGHSHHQSTNSQLSVENLGESLLAGLGYLPPQQNNRHALVNYPQNQQQQSEPLQHQHQEHDHHDHSANHQSQQGAHHNADQGYIPPDNLSNHGVSLQNIARSKVSNVNNQRGYLPPTHDHHSHQHGQHYNQPQNHDLHSNTNHGYLPPSQPEVHNQMTSLQTYMNGVHPNDRYGSSHYHQPPPIEKGNPPPPAVTSPPMFSKPSAIRAYAPGMAYRVSTNTPFSAFTPATYLPPVENELSQGNIQEQSNSIGFELNEEAKRNLARIMPKDNTVFPLDELLDIQDNDIDMPRLMEQLRGRIRTVQIINDHANSVKNIKVLETADQSGVKTIKILGQSNEDPMGEHKIVRIISKGPNPEGILQTVKIFSDHKEVSLPTQNAYLPPPKAKETYVRVLRHSQDPHRSH